MSAADTSQTLYLTNLTNRITALELKSSLYCLFSTYGEILDVTAKKTEKMREQAFVVYADPAAATTAMRSLNGFTFYDRPMKIQYAKTKSDAVALLDGTFRLRSVEEKKKANANMTVLGKRNATDESGQVAKKRDDSEDSDEDED
ncbi:uncharacterized protein BYT42DRAFT_618874 [Radiomyces spectabilis]|uniref:uncharacterized protein n=1 Tax=Radiomyces spectabilis TaxID=64574 RepID=UPI00221E9B27|nr:uncharacterized protein BYT42DRAFT_618874 [Radiomyces spectabilis]KAI8364725.1 hypothetical protein BYT42DRAFT_618874 [Radiomyces spectabilis]